MNRFHKVSLACLILGIVFFIIGVLSGDVETGFIVVFPFLIGSGIYAFLGFICIFIAILLFMFGFSSITIESSDLPFREIDDTRNKKSVKGGGVVLIGPIPIVFGSNWKIAVIMMVIAIILIITVFAFL